MSVVSTEHVRAMLRRVLRRSTKLAECERELALLTDIPFHDLDRAQCLAYSHGDGHVQARFATLPDARDWVAKRKPYEHIHVYVKAP